MRKERIWYVITNVIILIVMSLGYIAINDMEADIRELQRSQSQKFEDEIWWYKLQCALADPSLVKVSLAGDDQEFTVNERIYLKDFDDLCISKGDVEGGYYLTGGLVRGHILSLPVGTYYHHLNSGVMYVRESDVGSVDMAVEHYYRRLRYVLEEHPDIEIRAYGVVNADYPIDVGRNGSILSFGASGGGFVGANIYIDGRTVNGLGLGSFNPTAGGFNYTGNMHNTPLNLVPLPTGHAMSLQIVRNAIGVSYFKVHHCPDWW